MMGCSLIGLPTFLLISLQAAGSSETQLFQGLKGRFIGAGKTMSFSPVTQRKLRSNLLLRPSLGSCDSLLNGGLKISRECGESLITHFLLTPLSTND
jgi:hypothetical protein